MVSKVVLRSVTLQKCDELWQTIARPEEDGSVLRSRVLGRRMGCAERLRRTHVVVEHRCGRARDLGVGAGRRKGVGALSLLGDTLKVRREERGLGQEELAAHLGVRQQTVSRWELGLAVPRPARLLQLAEVLGLRADEVQRLAGYLPARPPRASTGSLSDLYDRMPELTRSELLRLIEEAWQELRGRDGPEPPVRA